MRRLVIGLTLLVLIATAAYAAPMSVGTVKAVGGVTISVPHCQVLNYYIAASDTISGVNANVSCDTTASFNINATVNSGASSESGSSGLIAFTADVPQLVAIAISPSVTISGQAYDAVVTVRN